LALAHNQMLSDKMKLIESLDVAKIPGLKAEITKLKVQLDKSNMKVSKLERENAKAVSDAKNLETELKHARLNVDQMSAFTFRVFQNVT